MIQWMTGDADGGMNGLGGDRADVGLVSEDPMNSFFLPASNTSAVLMLDSMSNVNDGGLWIFRVDQEVVIQPSKLVIHVQCIPLLLLYNICIIIALKLWIIPHRDRVYSMYAVKSTLVCPLMYS